MEDLPAGAMSAHNDIAFVIDPAGTIRQEISDDPGPGTTSTQSSYAALLAADARASAEPAMTPRSARRRVGPAALVIGAVLLAACASAANRGAAAPPAAAAAAAGAAPLATSMTAAGGGTWAIVAVGGSAADENLFWELFTRPAGSTQWALDTPPGVADNGGLVAAGSGERTHRRVPAEPEPDLFPAGFHQRRRQDLGHRADRRAGRRRP